MLTECDKHTLNSTVLEIREVSNGDKSGIYWLLNYPFPLSKRDVFFIVQYLVQAPIGQHVVFGCSSMNVVFCLNVGLGSILNVIRYLERQVNPKQLYILLGMHSFSK